MSEPTKVGDLLGGIHVPELVATGPVDVVEDRPFCEHVPQRNSGAYLDNFDLSVGKAARVGATAIRQIIEGELRGCLLTGPKGCGKTRLAASANNGIAEANWRLVAAIDDEIVQARAAAQVLRDRFVELGGQQHRAWASKDERADHPERAAAGNDYIEAGTALSNLEVRREQAVNRYERSCPAWISVTSLLGRMRREMNSEGERSTTAEVDHAMTARGLLVLDDLGAEKASEWTAATLFEIVDARYEKELATLVTSNKSARELDASGYGRIVSRLADEGALIELSSLKDYRMQLRRNVAD